MATNDDQNQSDNNAANLIRAKVDRIYSEEPDAKQELNETEQLDRFSKHQKYMFDLGNSGKDLAAIQTEWHDYYQGLPANEKHQVWQEFYSSQSLLTAAPAPEPTTKKEAHKLAEHKHQAVQTTNKKKKLRDARSKTEIQAAIREKVTAGGKLEAKHHLQSLLFGLGMGAVALVIFLFGFFNEVIIAPFIQPSRVEASTPLIVNSESVAASDTPEVIIPKINVQIPVDYTQSSLQEDVLQNALESGIVHYPTTTKPGENGNAAYFGHSSNNIFNKGKYKFAFVLLHTLTEGDTFYLTYNKKVYVYKVISKQVVDPSNVGVLNPVPGKTATATLITCDPPGTSLRRLVVVGEQISPDPSGNAAATAAPTVNDNSAAALPGNGPTLLGRLIGSAIGKIVIAAAIIGGSFLILRTARPRTAAGIINY